MQRKPWMWVCDILIAAIKLFIIVFAVKGLAVTLKEHEKKIQESKK